MYGLAVVTGAVFASCSTTDEAMDSIPYNRVLTPLNFKAEVVATTGTDVSFRWETIQNADRYELQIFEAESEPANYDDVLPLDVIVVEPNEIPYVAALEVDKTYYARVRGLSDKVTSSYWAYPEKADRVIKTYAVRSSLNPVVVTRTENAISIKWDNAADKEDLTSVRVAPVLDSKEATIVAVEAAEVEACEKTIEGLDAGVEYKLTLIFGQAGERGSVAAWTRPEMGQVVKVNTAQAIYDNIFGATGEVRLLVAYNDGVEYDMTEILRDPATGGIKSLTVSSDLYLFGEETEDGKKPIITNVEFSLNGAPKKVHLESIALNGKKSAGATLSVAAASNLSAIEFVNTEMYDYTKAIYSVASGTVANVDKLLISGVYAHDINANGANGGDFIDARDGLHADVEVMNSTFYACARTFLRLSDNAKGRKVSVHNCTFNYVTATDTSSNNSGVFHVRETTETSEVTCYNCLFLNMYNAKEDADTNGWIRIARNNATQSMAPACENNYYYNVGKVFLSTQAFVPQTGEPFATTGWTELADDPCVNSAAGKLYLTDGTIAANQVGDPRWWNAAEPKVERATELEVVNEETVWDFTEKTKFDTETVEANTIIENIRIYAPAEIVMSQGITFASAATLNASNIPTSSALGFKAAGYGSVKVETADGAYNASVHVLVGGDRITLPADGAEHKAVFGDLTGENDIYVLAGSAVTITKVTWTPGDAEAEDTKSALKAPSVTVTPSSITQGNEDGVDVEVSWAAVENAASYDVTFKGQTTETAQTSFTIAAAEAAALAVGEYEISVVAKPVATSSKYKASEATVAALNVKAKPVVGAPVTLTWDFSNAEWQAAFEAAAPTAKGTNQTDWTVSLDGLTYTSGTGNGKWDSDADGYFIQPNGGGSVKDDGATLSRTFSFTAPADGILKVTAKTASSGNARAVNVMDANKTQTQDVDALEVLEYEVAAGVVYTYPGGGIRFYKFEFTYIDGSASAGFGWNFSEVWSAKADLCADSQEYKLNDNGTVSVATDTTEKETLYFSPNAKKISIENRKSDSGDSFFGFKYGGAAAYAYINVDTPGTLTVEALASGDAGNNKLRIDVNGVKGTQVVDLNTPNTADAKCGIKAYEFEIKDITELSKVAIMKDSGGNSPEIYSITWTPSM